MPRRPALPERLLLAAHRHRTGAFITAAALGTLLAPAAHALIIFESGRSKIAVFGSATVVWDSNVFNNANAASDTYQIYTLGAEYERAAAIIQIKALAEITQESFGEFSAENDTLPHFRVSIAKGRGRLTGEVSAHWKQANSADTAANTRTRSRRSETALALRYPLNERTSFTSRTTYTRTRYQDAGLTDLVTWTEALDLFYVYTSKLDFGAGYRVRWDDLRGAFDAVDHAFTVGFKGRFLPRLEGGFRLGYQWRDLRQTDARRLDGVAASANFLWSPRNWIVGSLQLAKDFSTTSTALSADTLAASAEFRLATPRKLGLFAGGGWGDFRYFGRDGADTRRDDNIYLRAGADYPLTERIKATASYTCTRNQSTFAFADYTREFFALAVEGRF
jgi:hypothetical protein